MMTTELETAIERMVEEHGIDAVEAALDPLISKYKWQDWLAVCRYAQKVHRRIQANPPKSGRRAKSDAVK